METIQAYYDGHVFIPLTPVRAVLNQPALVTVLEFTKINHFFGALSEESYLEFEEALKDCERVDASDW